MGWHRFYNNNSSFVHGGLEVFNREGKPAVGQKQIHQCIQQLNFRDCHAKITQVDSQATLGNGVVVQVQLSHNVLTSEHCSKSVHSVKVTSDHDEKLTKT